MQADTVFILDVNNLDSYIACRYVSYYLKEFLSAVVLDGEPCKENKGLLEGLINYFKKQRILGISNVQILDELPDKSQTVICGSTLAKVADAIKDDKYIDILFASGGYAGDNIISHKNNITKSKSPILTKDLPSSIYVLQSNQIRRTCLVTENILRSKRNTLSGKLWESDTVAQQLFKIYNRSNVHIKNRIDHLVTSHYAISSIVSYHRILAPVLLMMNAYPDYDYHPDNKVYWYSITGRTQFRECILVYAFSENRRNKVK